MKLRGAKPPREHIDPLTLAVRVVIMLTLCSCLALVALGVCIGLAITARGHDYYSSECCDEADCHVIDSARVERVPEGYLLDHRWLFTFKDVKHSPDGKFSSCAPDPDVRPRCLYVPPDGA